MRFVKVIELPEGSSNPGIVPLDDFVREVVVKVENGDSEGGVSAATIFEQAEEPLQALPGDFWLTGD